MQPIKIFIRKLTLHFKNSLSKTEIKRKANKNGNLNCGMTIAVESIFYIKQENIMCKFQIMNNYEQI